MLVVADAEATFILSGTGDVIEPDDGVVRDRLGRQLRARRGARADARTPSCRRAQIAEAAMRHRGRDLHLHEREPDDRGAARRERSTRERQLTPAKIVEELDRYIVGQRDAKRAVAIALRNRWRRQQVEGDLRDEIAPKNIIMIGPTGVGKTEIARRLARLARAPFLKVEASKFTEVGYVGRDVDSIVRDLVEVAVKLVRDEEAAKVRGRARRRPPRSGCSICCCRAPSRPRRSPIAPASAADRGSDADAREAARACCATAGSTIARSRSRSPTTRTR